MNTPQPSQNCGSASRPRRSPRFQSHYDHERDAGADTTDFIRRSLFADNGYQKPPAQGNAVNDGSPSEDFDRLALDTGEFSDDDGFPPPPGPLPVPKSSRRAATRQLQLPISKQCTKRNVFLARALSASRQPCSIPPSTAHPPSTVAGSTQPLSLTLPGASQPPVSSTLASIDFAATAPAFAAPASAAPASAAPASAAPASIDFAATAPAFAALASAAPAFAAPASAAPASAAPAATAPVSAAPVSAAPASPARAFAARASAAQPIDVCGPPQQAQQRLQPARVSQPSEEELRVQLDKQNELRRLFVHVNRITVYEQKAIAAAFNTVQVGNKKIRACRLFVVISGIMERTHRNALEVLQEKALEKGKDFKTEYDRTIRSWGAKEENTVVPTIEVLEAEAGVRQHPRVRPVDAPIDDESDEEDDIQATNHRATGVSLEEFARLMIIFRDDAEAAADLRRSGQDLTREDLDTGRTRGAFWVDRIEQIFNDGSVITNEKLDAPLQDVDPGRPVSTYRDGACLKDLFAKFRQEFTELYGNWNTSGNMDPTTFVNFCRLPRTKTLSRSGARCLIAFRIFRFGLPNQDTLLLDFCSKQMANGSGARLESGLGSDGMSVATTSRAKKRLSEDLIQEDIHSLVRTLSAKDGNNDPATKKKKAELDELRLQRARREADRHLMQQLMETHEHRIQMNQSVDNRVSSIVDNYYQRLVEEAERMHASQTGNG